MWLFNSVTCISRSKFSSIWKVLTPYVSSLIYIYCVSSLKIDLGPGRWISMKAKAKLSRRAKSREQVAITPPRRSKADFIAPFGRTLRPPLPALFVSCPAHIQPLHHRLRRVRRNPADDDPAAKRAPLDAPEAAPPRRPRGRRHRGGAGRDVRVRRLGQRRGLAADPRPAPLRVGRQPRPPQGRPGGVGQAQGGPAVQVPPPSPSRWPAPVRRGAHWQLLREAIIPGHYSRAKIMAGARYE